MKFGYISIFRIMRCLTFFNNVLPDIEGEGTDGKTQPLHGSSSEDTPAVGKRGSYQRRDRKGHYGKIIFIFNFVESCRLILAYDE